MPLSLLRSLRVPMLATLLLAATVVDAAVVHGLYEAEVAAEGDGAEQRGRAVRDAFAEVLVKVTGTRGVNRTAEGIGLLREATRYLQQYRYRSEASAAGDASLPQQFLQVRFEQQAVERRLRELGLPIWGEARPLTLLWIGEEQGGRRALVAIEAEAALAEALDGAARGRGIPLLHPLLDLEDRGALSAGDIWGGFADSIARASVRYAPDTVATARLRALAPQNHEAAWTLFQNGRPIADWRSQGDSTAGALASGVDGLADRLAERFAPRLGEGAATPLLARISGVDSLAALVRVERYLGSLGIIESLRLVATAPGQAQFALQVQGGTDALRRGVELGGVLEPEAPPVATLPVVRQPAPAPVIAEGRDAAGDASDTGPAELPPLGDALAAPPPAPLPEVYFRAAP